MDLISCSFSSAGTVTSRATPTSTSIRPIPSKDEKTSDKDEEAKQEKNEERSEVEAGERHEVPVTGEEFEVRKPRIGEGPFVPTKAEI